MHPETHTPPPPLFADHGPLVPGVGLVEWVEAQASWYRSFETEAGDLLAAWIDRLAGEIREGKWYGRAI